MINLSSIGDVLLLLVCLELVLLVQLVTSGMSFLILRHVVMDIIIAYHLLLHNSIQPLTPLHCLIFLNKFNFTKFISSKSF